MDKKNLRKRALKATQAQLVSITLETAIGCIEEFLDSQSTESLLRSRQAIFSLIQALDFRYEPARILFKTYLEANKKLCLAEAWKDSNKAKQAHGILANVLDVWRKFEDKPKPEDPGYVVSGLTYSGCSLN
jgi:flagellin-specific chaperone FliS